MGTGSAFSDINNPQVVVRVGAPGSSGIVEITDMLFTTRGPSEFSPVNMTTFERLNVSS